MSKNFLLLITAIIFSTLATAEKFAQVLNDVFPEVEKIYRDIHENPELGKKEFRTQQIIKDKLRSFGYNEFIPVQSAPTAVITVLNTGRKGPTIAFRAEMDARPMPGGEIPTNNPRSKIPHLMHNCGHDAHTSILLGVARILKSKEMNLIGKIFLVFQPAEEIRGGADDIVREGILTKNKVEAIFALHVAHKMKVGTIGIAPGNILAGSNYFKLEINGKGSHAALPSGGSDVLLAAGEIIVGLSKLPARKLDIANRPCVISITTIATPNKATNILPSQVTMRGTIRAFEDLWNTIDGQKPIIQIIEDYLEAMSKLLDIEVNFTPRRGVPPTENNLDLYNRVTPELYKSWSGTLQTDSYKGMFSEDFSFYTRDIPSLYFSLGIAKGDLGLQSVHTNSFNLDPKSLKYGVELFLHLAEIFCGRVE